MNTLLEAITKRAEATPQKVALTGLNRRGQPAKITYSGLLSKVQHAAESLRAQKIKSLALRAENSVDWAIVDLAAMIANIVVIPIPTFFSASQVEHILSQSDVEVLIGHWQDIPVFVQNESKAIYDTNIKIVGYPLYRTTTRGYVSYLEGTGKITFTSGSTGQPKGVCLSNEHLCRVASSLAQSVKGLTQSHLVLLPLSTLLENITGIYVPLLLGVTSTILSGERTGLLGSSQLDTHSFARVLDDIKPDSLVLTPALLLALIHVVKQQPSLATPLKFVAVGGARVSSQLINAAHTLGIPAFEGYGLSECGSVVCLNTPTGFKPGTCGRPLPHVKIEIAEDGELFVKGNNALGYLNEPFSNEWLATGDLAQFDEQGFITLSGRKTNLIVTAYGRNVSPEWIESEALSILPETPLIVSGDSQQGLCAIVAESDNLETKFSVLNETLPDYAQIHTLLVISNPKAIVNWHTANGKVKRVNVERYVAQILNHSTSEFMLEGQKGYKVDLLHQPFTAS